MSNKIFLEDDEIGLLNHLLKMRLDQKMAEKKPDREYIDRLYHIRYKLNN